MINVRIMGLVTAHSHSDQFIQISKLKSPSLHPSVQNAFSLSGLRRTQEKANVQLENHSDIVLIYQTHSMSSRAIKWGRECAQKQGKLARKRGK